MGVDIRWDILANGIQDQRRQWEKIGDGIKADVQRRDLGRALADYRADPSNTKALDYIYMNSPKLADSIEDRGRKQQTQNALTGLLNPSGGGSPPVNALMPAPAAGAFGGTAPTGGSPSRLGANLAAPRAPRMDLSNPQFRNLVALDHETAFKLADGFSKMDDATRKQQESRNGMLGSAAMHLRSVPQEQRGAALAQIAPQMLAAGFTPEELEQADLSDAGLQGYTAMAMDVKTILGQQRLDRRLEWDIEDDVIDNTRADRSTDSLVASRGATAAQGWQRVGIQREGMQRTDARGRRGQDLSAETGRRGQDMTDRRAREGVGASRGRRLPAGANIPLGSPLSPTNAPIAPRAAPRAAPARQAAPAGRIIVNPQTGERMQLRGKQWVKVQ